MSDTSTTTALSPAETLAERLQNTTLDEMQSKHPLVYTAGAWAAATQLDVDELRSLDAFFVEHVEDAPLAELDAEELFTGLSHSVGLEPARQLLRDAASSQLLDQIDGAMQLAVFLRGIVDTWREADV